MKLYPKTIKSVNDLEQERRKLLKKKRDLDKDQLFSLGGAGKDKKDNKDSKASWMDILPVSSPVAAFVLDILRKRMRKKQRQPVYYDHKGNAQRSGESKVKKLAFEFVGGYLKWKAIELSVKGIQHLMKQRKEKRELVQQKHSYR